MIRRGKMQENRFEIISIRSIEGRCNVCVKRREEKYGYINKDYIILVKSMGYQIERNLGTRPKYLET